MGHIQIILTQVTSDRTQVIYTCHVRQNMGHIQIIHTHVTSDRTQVSYTSFIYMTCQTEYVSFTNHSYTGHFWQNTGHIHSRSLQTKYGSHPYRYRFRYRSFKMENGRTHIIHTHVTPDRTQLTFTSFIHMLLQTEHSSHSHHSQAGHSRQNMGQIDIIHKQVIQDRTQVTFTSFISKLPQTEHGSHIPFIQRSLKTEHNQRHHSSTKRSRQLATYLVLGF